MEKKKNVQIDQPEPQEGVNELGIIRSEKNDPKFLSEEEEFQNEEDEDSDFRQYENEDFAGELNQQKEDITGDDLMEFEDNPYLDDEDFEDPALDIPGSELDDEMENVGSEDEENNYYSLGGDNHEDLEEHNIEDDL